MIAINVNAGLANQMFHYAFGRGLIAKGYNVVFDQSNFKPRKQWSFENVQLQDAFPNIELKKMPEGHFRLVFFSEDKPLGRFIYLYSRLLQKFGIEKYINEPTYAFCPNIEERISGNCIFKGLWQSEKYFSHCKEDIIKQFEFMSFDEQKNIEISSKMKSENSVAIHLRKGKDYLQSELMGKGLCPTSYYMNAIDYIKHHVDNPVFYVFTDNPNWVKENLNSFDYILVDWNPVSGKKNFRDMQLMTCCKHNIIANSTYSWWGAWLNPNPDKIVIGPKKFFNPIDDYFSKQDIMCENWIQI